MEAELESLLREWGIDDEGIKIFSESGISTINVLKMMRSCDINEIFINRCDINRKIIFRYHLQKWRLQNNFDAISCCGSDKTVTNSSSTISDWLQNDCESTFDLKEVLSTSVAGQDVLQKYESKIYLNEQDQSAISRIIVDYFILKNIKMQPRHMLMVSKSIVALFPTEVESTYYIRRQNKKKPSGKIFDRYFNSMYKRKPLKTPTKNIKLETVEAVQDECNYVELIKKKFFLIHNQPSNLLDIWKETRELRMKEQRENLSNIFNNWPRYKDPIGCDLINVDFAWLFPGKENNLFNKIAQLEADMCDLIFPTHIKDKLNLNYFEKIKEKNMQTDSIHFYLFYLLHAVILPPRLSNTCKPSISDAQHDMIIHLNNINNIQQKLDELREDAIYEKVRAQPKIIAIGDTIENLKEFYIYLAGNRYKVPTLVSAIDLVIKCCFVFNLEYSAKSKYVWIFLQEYIYEIPSNEKIAKIGTFINKLRK